jgi:hypothetical protein
MDASCLVVVASGLRLRPDRRIGDLPRRSGLHHRASLVLVLLSLLRLRLRRLGSGPWGDLSSVQRRRSGLPASKGSFSRDRWRELPWPSSSSRFTRRASVSSSSRFTRPIGATFPLSASRSLLPALGPGDRSLNPGLAREASRRLPVRRSSPCAWRADAKEGFFVDPRDSGPMGDDST